MPTTYPHGSRFHPTELGLVKLHLNEKVENNNSGFIKTLNVYGDAPWLLDHDTNPLYCRNEWYYFVPRTIRGVKTVSRMVPGNEGESFLGGTWKSIGKRKEIKNRAKELKGYKRELVFNKNVVGKSEKEKTDWHMDEYSLHKNGDEFHDLVLCHVRLLNSAERFKPRVPAAHQVDHENNDNNVLPNQEQQGDVNQQHEREEEQEDSRIPLHPPLHSNNNNNQGQYLLETTVYQNDMMILHNDRGNNVLPNQEQQEAGDVNQQQQPQQEDSRIPLHPPLQSNYNNQGQYVLEASVYQNDMVILDNGRGYLIQQQQQEQEDSRIPLQYPHQSNYNNQGQYLLEAIAYQNDTMVLENYRGYLIQQQQQQDLEDAYMIIINNNLDQIQFDDLAYMIAYDELKPILDEDNDVNQQHDEQQQDSPTLLHPPLQSNDNNQEQCPPGDIAFEGAADGLMFDPEEVLRTLDEGKKHKDSPTPLLQSNVNQEQCLSRDTIFVPSQVENNDNDNNDSTVLPNQEQQQEAGFANQNGMTMVKKEHGYDDVKQHQQQQDQKQLPKDLQDFLLVFDAFDFDDGVDDWLTQN